MSTPAIIMIVLGAMGLLISAHDHGKPKTGEHSFWISIISNVIFFGLLIWGGFFK